MRKILFLFSLFLSVLFSKTLVVDNNPSCVPIIGCSDCLGNIYLFGIPYQHIQDALNDAQNGDTIKVCPGEYDENLSWPLKDNIILEGATGNRDDVIINASNEDALKIAQNWTSVIIKHITFKSKKKGIYITSDAPSLLLDDICIDSQDKNIYIDGQIYNSFSIKDSNLSSENAENIYVKNNISQNIVLENITMKGNKGFYVEGDISKNLNLTDVNISADDKALEFNGNVSNLNIRRSNLTSNLNNGIDADKNLNRLNIKDSFITVKGKVVSLHGQLNNGAIIQNCNFISDDETLKFYDNVSGDININNSNFVSNNSKGIYFTKNINNKIDVIDVNIISKDKSVVVGGDVDGGLIIDNSELNSSDSDVMQIKGNAYNEVNISDSIFKSNGGYGIRFMKNIDKLNFFNNKIFSYEDSLNIQGNVYRGLEINKSELNSSDNDALEIHGNIYGDIEEGKYDLIIKNSLLEANKDIALKLNYGNDIDIKINNSKFYSKKDSAAVLVFKAEKSVKIKNSCFKTEANNGYGLNLNLDTSNDNVHINTNCFYAKSVDQLAKSSKSGYDWDSNYWDGLSESTYHYNNILDEHPLSSCPNGCGEENNLPKPIIDYHMDECSWDNDPNTFEIKNYGSGGNNYNATGLNEANVTEGKICNGGDINSTITKDKAVLLKTNYSLPSEYTLNLWIRFPLNTKGHKDFRVCVSSFLGICLEYKIVNYLNIADRVGDNKDYIYFVYNKTDNVWSLIVSSDNGGADIININPQNLSGWHMLTFVVSDEGTDFYLDGDLNSRVTSHPNTGKLGLLFNSDFYSSNNKPNGQSIGSDVDEFEIYEAMLNRNEIKNILYTNENSGKDWNGSVRICPFCGEQHETNGTFNAVDYINHDCNAVNDWDNNITTKIVNKDFNLTILAKDKDTNSSLETNITKVDFYEYNTNDCSGDFYVENICTNCGQTSARGCLAVSNIKINKAIRCIKVHIEGNVTNPVNPIQESNSTDNFAVRPCKYKIVDLNKRLIAGKDINLTIKALDCENNLIKDFNFSNAPVEINVTDAIGCKKGDFSFQNPVNFVDGEANVIFNYSEVGDINLSIKEDKNGNEFASVDEGQENNNVLLIGEGNSTVKRFVPAYFEINASLSNYDTDKNFTYLDDNLSVYSILDINIIAKNEQNKTTQNYNKDCYAKDIKINVSKNLSPFPDNLNHIVYFYKDAENNKSDVFSQDINDTIEINYTDTNFTTEHNGSTNLTLYINFDRNFSKPVDPFEMNISEINVTDTDEVNGTNKSVKGNATYYYGRLVLFDEMANKNEFDTRDNYFVIYDENESDNKIPKDDNNVTYEILPNWYVNYYHQSKDGNVSDKNITVSRDYNACDKISGIDVNVNSIDNGKVNFHIKRDNASIKFAVVHLLEPDLKWLWYSKYEDEYNISDDSTCLNHFCFSITWQENGEKGIIKSGEVKGTESNVTDENVTKRGVKIFR